MEHILFGNTGKAVSRVGFGGAVAGLKNYLTAYDPADRDDARNICLALERALELGINYFDTAIGYGDGASERLFGDVLKDADPARIFLATKCGPSSYADTLRSAEKSLKNLRADRIDLLQIHGGSYTDGHAADILGKGGMLDALERLKKEGVIGSIGFTTEDNNPAVYDMIADGRFDMYQICYNLFFQHPCDFDRPFGSMREAEKRNMGVVTMRSTTSGMFMRWMRKVDPGNPRDYTRDLIQFVFSNPLVDVVLVGMRNAEEVEKNVDIWRDEGGRLDIKKDLYTFFR